MNLLPSLNDIKTMIDFIKSKKSKFVIFDEKCFFYLNDLYALQVVHEMKGVKEAVLEEKKWFGKLEKGVKSPPNLKRIGFEDSLNGF